MLKWIFAFALTLLSVSAQAQRSPSYLPPELVRAIANPGYAEKSLIQQVRFPRGTYAAIATAQAFNGNPNVTISSIGGAFTSSRDADSLICEAPCFMQVSGAGITGVGTSAPYEDLSYSWDFGNGCGTVFVRPTDGANVCSGTGQRQPEAVYRYDTPNTYIITLTVTGCAGSVGAANTANSGICGALIGPTTFTKTITVNPFSGADKYADCGANPGTADGSLANPWVTLAQMTTAASAGSVALHLKPGCTFTSSTNGLYISPSGNISKVRIDKNYPAVTGANPKIQITNGATQSAFRIENGGASTPHSINDVVIDGIDIENAGAVGQGIITMGGNDNAAGNAGIRNLYFADGTASQSCNCASTLIALTGQPALFGNPSVGTNYGFWNFNSFSPTNGTVTVLDNNELGAASDWHFRVGGSVTGTGVSADGSHHIYNEIRSHGLYQWVTCGPTGTGQARHNYCFNGNFDGDVNAGGQHLTVNYITYAENSCKYTQYCVDLGNRTNNQATFFATGGIVGTTLTVTAYSLNTALISPLDGGSYLISGANGGGSLITANTRVTAQLTGTGGAPCPDPTCTGTTGTYSVSISQSVAPGTQFIGADSTVQYQYVVIAANAFDGMGPENFQAGQSVTLRDNRLWNTPLYPAFVTGSQFFAPPNTQRSPYNQGASLNARVYRNKAYIQTGGYVGGPVPALVFENTWTTAQVITDNVIVDGRSLGGFVQISYTDMLASGSVINRNTYSQIGGNTSPWYNVSSTQNFSNWQNAGTSPARWDANGVNLAGGTPSGWGTATPASWSDFGN